MKTRNILASIAALGLLANAHAARAAEYYVGDAIEKNNLVIEPNYLTGIEMSRMPEGMTSGPDVIHLEVDVHAAAHEPHGFAEGENYIILNNRGYSYLLRGNVRTARRLLERAILLAPGNPTIASNIAIMDSELAYFHGLGP